MQGLLKHQSWQFTNVKRVQASGVQNQWASGVGGLWYPIGFLPKNSLFSSHLWRMLTGSLWNWMKATHFGSLRAKLILALLACQNEFDPQWTGIGLFFVQTSTLPASMHQLKSPIIWKDESVICSTINGWKLNCTLHILACIIQHKLWHLNEVLQLSGCILFRYLQSPCPRSAPSLIPSIWKALFAMNWTKSG